MNATEHTRPTRDRRDAASRLQLLCRVKAEFEEMPSLRLTRGQAQRLFGLRADVCERVLATLVRDHTLCVGADDRYRMFEDVAWRRSERLGADLRRHNLRAS